VYADPRYGYEYVLVAGDLKSAHPAIDLMQALALCVAGTWRRVGPAFVLTDDREGIGAWQQFLSDVVSGWGDRLQDACDDVDKHLKRLG
jgi:hypothetical protein